MAATTEDAPVREAPATKAAHERLSEFKETKEWPYRFDIVPIKHMIVDIYQRPLTSLAEEIGNDFDPALVGTVVLSERSKTRMALVDGQTRAAGAQRAGITELPAIVYEGLTMAQEADLFAKFQTQRRGMHSVHRFNAQVHAKYPMQVAINELVEQAGFRIDSNAGSDRRGISSPAALEFVYKGATEGSRRKVESPELLKRTLEVISEAWPKQPPEARSAVTVRGLGYFLKQNEDDVDLGRLIERLSRVQPSELAKRAASLREGYGMSGNSPRYMAEAIDSQYRRR